MRSRSNGLLLQDYGRTKPTLGFLFRHPAHWIALGFGSGLSPVLPGTVGTFLGWGLFVLLNPYMSDAMWVLGLSLSFVLGCVCCHITGRALGVIDHGSIVWDEIVAIAAVLFVANPLFHTPLQQLLCVLLFRFYDMVKPPPIRWFDRHWKNGFGVMFDDVVAAFMTLLTLAFLIKTPLFT